VTRTERFHDRVRVEFADGDDARLAWLVVEPGDGPVNSFGAGTVEGMTAALDAAVERARVVAVRGEGGFLVGADIRHLRDSSAAARPDAVDDIVSASNEFVRRVRDAPALVVAAVTGTAAGGGFGFALACDLVVAHAEAAFDAAYARIGLTPDNATPFYLTRLLGPSRARQLLLSPDPLPAREAHDLGLVAAVVDGPLDEFDDRAAAFLDPYARAPPELLRETKRLVDTALETTLDEHLALEREAVVEASTTERFAEGLDAFFERRDPDWA
jgi:2-(1,2-epoxy-1,2-dihydrophenyl)acetyl-CoA isomerase